MPFGQPNYTRCSIGFLFHSGDSYLPKLFASGVSLARMPRRISGSDQMVRRELGNGVATRSAVEPLHPAGILLG
jgi:hypothetical protein